MRYRELILTGLLLVTAPLCGTTADEPTYGGRTLSAWVERLKDRDAAVRKEAARALGQFRDKGQAAVRPLIEALRDADEEVRDAAALALDRIEARGKEAVELLVAMLKDRNQATRGHAILQLARIGKEAVEPLIEALRDPATRAAASVALNGMGKRSVRGLAAALQDREGPVRRSAADVLERIGAPACVALPDLMRAALLDPDRNVRQGSAEAVVSILGWLCREDKGRERR
jgi:HEAT repeat protein